MLSLRVPILLSLSFGLFWLSKTLFAGSLPQPFEAWIAGLKEPLERRFPSVQLDPTDNVAGIIVLGGRKSRFLETEALAKRFPAARIIATGAADEELNVLRFAVGRLSIEQSAKSTFENAVYAKQMAKPRPFERWILVTSALHMPRSMGTFSAVDFPVEPWAIYDSSSQPRYVVGAVLHEILALMAYRILGRTRVLFPGPELSASTAAKS
jgi:uncharacterized SAM-binding protein YcdF (DUF218 family)